MVVFGIIVNPLVDTILGIEYTPFPLAPIDGVSILILTDLYPESPVPPVSLIKLVLKGGCKAVCWRSLTDSQIKCAFKFALELACVVPHLLREA